MNPPSKRIAIFDAPPTPIPDGDKESVSKIFDLLSDVGDTVHWINDSNNKSMVNNCSLVEDVESVLDDVVVVADCGIDMIVNEVCRKAER